jgi:hypothetical protein
MEWLLEQIAKEAQMIAAAPLHFIFAVCITSVLGWLVLRFLYMERLESLKGLNTLYRDRFGPLNSESSTPLGKLKNRKLAKRSDEVAAGLDRLVDKLETMTRQATIAKPEPAQWIGMFQHVSAVYEKEYKQDAILLRAEMNSRILSHGLRDPGPPVGGLGTLAYEFPTNSFGLREVASDLRRLSKLLP